MPPAAMLLKFLAMVTRKDDECVVVQALGLEPVKQLAQMPVQIADLAVVQRAEGRGQ